MKKSKAVLLTLWEFTKWKSPDSSLESFAINHCDSTDYQSNHFGEITRIPDSMKFLTVLTPFWRCGMGFAFLKFQNLSFRSILGAAFVQASALVPLLPAVLLRPPDNLWQHQFCFMLPEDSTVAKSSCRDTTEGIFIESITRW